ncbi:MAG: outer membrane beta-barrel protein [Acidobacteria bacterium]|nr:outer membrane beta-barrel protein [Acidobacteriota bacterium]
MRLVTALVMAGLLAGVNEAAAQDEESRFFLSVSGAFEPGTQTYADDGTFPLYDETGRLSVSSEVSSGAVLDFGVGARLVGRWTVGANFHRTSSTDESTVDGSAPHPIFFDRPRPFSTTVQDLKRSEQALHLSVGYLMPLNEKFDLQVYAGPSQFRFSQEVVGTANIRETGGTFSTIDVTYSQERRKKSAWGGHVGADLSYALYQDGATSFRLGGYLRYAGASSEFPVVSSTVSTKLGGVQIGAGLRVRF